MHHTILLIYTNYFLNNFQCTYLTKQRNFTMEFLDSGATCTTSLIGKSAHFVVLKTHKPRRFEIYCFLRKKGHMIHNDACYTSRSSHFAYLLVNTILIISQSLLLQAHSLYQIEFSRQGDRVLLILITNTFSFL
jgi:hypothetical protein